MNSCFIFHRFEVETQRKESTVETATDSNAKRSASRKRTYLGIAVALVVLVGAAGVAISANGGQDKSQRSGATVTGKKGSAVTITNITGSEMSITETRTGTRKVLHSCLGPKGQSILSATNRLAADQAYSHEVGAYPVMRRTDPAACTVSFERSVGGQIDDLRLEVRWCIRPSTGACTDTNPTFDAGPPAGQIDMTFQSAGVIGPAQRNVVLDSNYIMNGNSNSYFSNRNAWQQADVAYFGFDLAYNGQRANNGKYVYAMTFKDVNCAAYGKDCTGA